MKLFADPVQSEVGETPCRIGRVDVNRVLLPVVRRYAAQIERFYALAYVVPRNVWF